MLTSSKDALNFNDNSCIFIDMPTIYSLEYIICLVDYSSDCKFEERDYNNYANH